MDGVVIEASKNQEGKIGYGECQFCRQMFSFEIVGDPNTGEAQELLDRWATERCKCIDAGVWREEQGKKEKARKNIEKLFRKDLPQVADILMQAVEPVSNGYVASVSINTGAEIVASIREKKGKLVVSRKVTTEDTLEN